MKNSLNPCTVRASSGGSGPGAGPVVALGEALIRLSPPRRRRLEQASCLEISVGGAELNTLIVLSQLGFSTTLITRLPANPLGRLIARHARSYAVDILAEWDQHRRAGTYYIEHGAPPRATEVIYDRAGSAASELHPSQFDWKAITAGASAVHVTGITSAIGVGAHNSVRALLEAAHDQGVPTSFDLNHRLRLWSEAEAADAFRTLLPLADVVFASVHDLALVLGRPNPTPELAPVVAARFGIRALVVRETVRPSPDEIEVTIGVVGEDTATSSAFRARVIDPFGAGDVAAGVFLATWLTDGSAAAAVERSARAYAHMNTIPGDAWAGDPLELADDYSRGRTILR